MMREINEDTSGPNQNLSTSLSAEELHRCRATLEAIVNNRALLTQMSLEDRQALLSAAGRISRPHKPEERQLVKAFRKAARLKRIAKDRDAVANTAIRVAREAPVFVPPPLLLTQTQSTDMSATGGLPTSAAAGQTLEQENLTCKSTGVQATGGVGADSGIVELIRPKNCYVCKKEYRQLHFFYDSMCPECGDFNYAKRFQTAPLNGRYALITGSRVKIGFQASLLLLRAGATVIATTRFPHDSALRYSREPDFAQWKDRLHIFGLDLRHSPSVEILCRYLNLTLPRLDFLLNNACQTVRRPAGFYASMLEFESQPVDTLPPEQRQLLKLYEDCKHVIGTSSQHSQPQLEKSDVVGLAAFHSVGEGPGMGLRASALMSQIRYTYDDAACGAEIFPTGQTDADLQQIDLRTQNSWRMTLAEVPTPELLEVQLVNAVAPFILCARLKPLFLKQSPKTNDQHIVNVSAMEGIFSRGTKTDKHPHTNMAKAALNMMTLTSSKDYIKDGIHMNAVDTGWITDEDPAQHAQRKRTELDFQPPLDIVDGAARICDPIFAGLISGQHEWGKFFKDYKPGQW